MARELPCAGAMRYMIGIVACWAATAAYWSMFGACVVSGPGDPPLPQVHLVTEWDPAMCGDPHRVVIELEDDSGAAMSASTPCETGSLSLDAQAYGVYRGRIYAWALGAPIRSISPVVLTLDAPEVHWRVITPR